MVMVAIGSPGQVEREVPRSWRTEKGAMAQPPILPRFPIVHMALHDGLHVRDQAAAASNA